jgi:hypothetical protein
VANNLAVDASRTESQIKDLDECTWKTIEESRPGLLPDPEKLMLQRERLDRLHTAVLNLTTLRGNACTCGKICWLRVCILINLVKPKPGHSAGRSDAEASVPFCCE